jgi:2'-5' RNA ligase
MKIQPAVGRVEDRMLQTETWRVFCAIDLPHEVREKMSAHSMRLRQAVPEARASWSRPDNIHLTLKFLGEIPQPQVEALSNAAEQACNGLPTFTIRVQGSGVFPVHGAPRVLWIGIEDLQGNLGELYQRLEQQAAKGGFEKEARPFHPHLTLARLRSAQHARRLGAVHKEAFFEPTEFKVSELLVIRSELSSEGSRYSVITRHALDASEKH